MSPLDTFETIWAESVAATVPYVETVNYGVDTNDLPDVWGACIWQPETREDVVFGSAPWVDEQGQFLIGLFARSGTGPKVLDDAVGAVRQAYHGAIRGGLVIFAVDGPHDLEPQADGEWWQLALTARYTLQSRRFAALSGRAFSAAAFFPGAFSTGHPFGSAQGRNK